MAETRERRPMADKVAGALLGAAIGDAVGWPQEQNSRNLQKTKRVTAQVKFQEWKRSSGGRFYAFEDVVRAGEYSDDTQLLLATARSLRKGTAWHRTFYKFELPLWLSYERGGGGATKRAAQCWSRGSAPWMDSEFSPRYFQAGGNGVAMRISPHVFVANQTLPELFKQVMLNGVATHGHPRALVGALAYAYALWLASRNEGTLEYGSLIEQLLSDPHVWGVLPDWGHGQSEWLAKAEQAFSNEYQTVWRTSVEELIQGLRSAQNALKKGALAISEAALGQLGAFDPEINGAGTTTTVVVLYLASRYAADPVTGLLEAAFAPNTDTDTYASMVGGLLGTIRGTEWIHPEWRHVQDAAYISHVSMSLLEEVTGEGEPVPGWDKKADAYLMKSLGSAKVSEVNLSYLGRAKVAEVITHRPIAKTSVAKSWKLVTSEGQTLYVTKFSRVEESTLGAEEKGKVGGTQKEPIKPPEAPAGAGAIAPVQDKLLHLFGELKHSFPPHVPAAAAFEAITEALGNADRVRRELEERPDSTQEERDVWFRNLLHANPILGRNFTVRELKHVLKALFSYLK